MYVEVAPSEAWMDYRKRYCKDRKDVTRFGASWIVPDADFAVDTNDINEQFLFQRLSAHKDLPRCVQKNVPLVGCNVPFRRIKNSFDIHLPTHLVELDFDFYLTITVHTLPLADRIEIILHELPWLRNVAGVWQLSSSACFDWVLKDGKPYDYSKRISCRFWFLASEALSQADWRATLMPLATPGRNSLFDHSQKGNKGLFDQKLFDDTPMLHFSAPPDITQVKGVVLPPGDDLILTEGNRLDISELRSNRNICVPVSASGDYRDISLHSHPGKFDQIIYGTQDDLVLDRLKEFDVRGSTNEILPKLYLMRASRDIFTVPRLTDCLMQIENGIYVNQKLWDKDWQGDPNTARTNLEAKERWSLNVVTDLFLAKDSRVLNDFGWQRKVIPGKTIQTDDVADITLDGDYVFSLDTGMGKTETVGRMIVEDCIHNNKRLVYITPLKSLSLGDAKELSEKLGVPVNTYLSFGSTKEEISQALQQSIVFMCYQGLERFKKFNLEHLLPQFHTLMTDEAATILMDGKCSDADTDNFKVYSSIFTQAKRTVSMDHDINQRYHLKMISILREHHTTRRVLYENIDSYNAGKNYVFHSNYYDGMLECIERINNGQKVYINVDFANWTDGKQHNKLQAFHQTFKHFCPGKKSVSYDTNSLPYHIRENFAVELERLVDDGLDYCIFNPAVGRGVSYIPDDPSKDFDYQHSFQKSPHSNGNTTVQASNRGRRTTEHGTSWSVPYFPGERRFNERRLLQYRQVHLSTTALITQYQVLVADQQELLRSNPSNHQKILLRNKNCNLFDIADEGCIYDCEPNNIKKVHQDKVKQAGQNTMPRFDMDALSQFLEYDNKAKMYKVPLDDFYYENNPKEFEKLFARHKFLTQPSVVSYLETMLYSYQECEAIENKDKTSTFYIKQYKELFDALLAIIDPFVPGSKCLRKHTVSHSQEAIYINLDEIDSTSALLLIKARYSFYERMTPKLSPTAKSNIFFAIRYLAKILDYDCTREHNETSAIEERDAIYKQMIRKHPDQFSQSDRVSSRKQRIIKYLWQKIGTEDLDESEANYLLRHDQLIILKKPRIIHKQRLYSPALLAWADK